jgi:hypothetical protein
MVAAARHLVIGEADHRLHRGQLLVVQPAEALVSAAEILERRQLGLAQIVGNELLPVAAGLERAA